MKILHCSDIHLGKKPFGTKEFSQKRYLDFFKAFDEMIDIGIEENIDLFIVAGDLFDKKELTPDTLERCEKSFQRLKNRGIKVFLIEGNHDNIVGNDEVNSWLGYLEKKEFIHRGKYYINNREYEFEKLIVDDVNIYGLGYSGFMVDELIEKLAEKLDENEKNIVVIHTALGGGEYLPGLATSEAIKKLKDKAIYVAGGHLHSYQTYPKEDPFFFIPGSLEYWNVLNEKSDKKGGIIFDTDTREHRFVEITPRKRMEVTFEYINDLKEEFKLFCEQLNLTGEELVIANIKVNGNGFVNVVELENILESLGALRGYIRLQYVDNMSGNIVDEKGVYSIKVAELKVISGWEDFRDSNRTLEYLQKFKEYQEESNRKDDFLELFDQMLEEEIGIENK